jgi:hypothetical protein
MKSSSRLIFLLCLELVLGAFSRLTVQTVGAAQFPESLLGARSDSDLWPGAPTGTLFSVPSTVRVTHNDVQVNLR